MNPAEILRDHGLRLTGARREILQIFQKDGYALSHSDLEKTLSDKFDRVTIYRTLTTFMDKGIIHKVLDDSDASKYALCAEHCNDHEHHDNHVHFKCSKCGHSKCLNDLEIPTLSLPSGYKVSEANLLFEGVCAKCA